MKTGFLRPSTPPSIDQIVFRKGEGGGKAENYLSQQKKKRRGGGKKGKKGVRGRTASGTKMFPHSGG